MMISEPFSEKSHRRHHSRSHPSRTALSIVSKTISGFFVLFLGISLHMIPMQISFSLPRFFSVDCKSTYVIIAVNKVQRESAALSELLALVRPGIKILTKSP